MNVTTGTITRTIILVVALVNQTLTVFGHSPLPIEDEAIVSLVSLIVTVGAALLTWWKNQSFTKAAIEADTLMHELKNK